MVGKKKYDERKGGGGKLHFLENLGKGEGLITHLSQKGDGEMTTKRDFVALGRRGMEEKKWVEDYRVKKDRRWRACREKKGGGRIHR